MGWGRVILAVGRAARFRSADTEPFNQPTSNLSNRRRLALQSAEMLEAPLVPRFARSRLEEALTDSPVVLIHGPRQSGKTTLAREVGAEHDYAYFNLDDDTLRAAAQADPMGFVADLPAAVIIDEVQRLPELFTALKAAVDRNRTPGRFILTGSSNVLLLPKLADSLAGRMEVISLLPLSQAEVNGSTPWFLDAFARAAFQGRNARRLGPALAKLVAEGGYPAARARKTPSRRAAWYRNYAEALVQRDVRDLSRISRLDILPRLLEVAAGQTARLLNVSDLAAPFQVSRPTIRDYVTLLERVFLVDEQPSWHANRMSRLIKAPKLHIGDTGLGTALMRVDAAALYEDRGLMGQMVETFVYQELRKQALARTEDTAFFHYRDKDRFEVDIVVELGGRHLGGVEVKAASTVTSGDFRGLRRLSAVVGSAFRAGVVLYDGERSLSFGDGMFAVPLAAIWS